MYSKWVLVLIHSVIIFSAVGVWEALADLHLISPLIISSIERILAFGMRYSGSVVANLPYTLEEVAISIILVLPLALFFGLIIGYYSSVDNVFTPVLTALFAIPAFIFYPLFIVWFGLGTWSKVALAFSVGFFPLILNVSTAVRTVDRTYVRYARSVGLNTLGTMRKIIVPLISPAILASFKVSVAFIIVGVIVSEMLGGYGGLGVLIAQYQSELLTPMVYFVVSFVFLIVIATIFAMGYLESIVKRRISS